MERGWKLAWEKELALCKERKPGVSLMRKGIGS
jgi:hypothetical protein